jgi:hypothetical protein
MRSFIISTLFLSIISFNLFAQITDPIIVARNGINKAYLQNGEYLTHDQLIEVLKSKPESEEEYNWSEAQGKVFGVLSLPAVIFVAVDRIFNWVWLPVGNEGKSDRSRQIETTIGLSVLGLAAIGVPFIISSNAHLKKSIHNYNNALIPGKTEGININIGLMGNGVGVQLRF